MTASFRRPASALPRCSSDAPSPYAFAVSKKLIPRSRHALTMRADAAGSATRFGSPKLIAPRPITETSRSDQPSRRCGIAVVARARSVIAWSEAVDVVDVREYEIGQRNVDAQRRGEVPCRADVLVARGGLMFPCLTVRGPARELLRGRAASLRIGHPDRLRERIEVHAGPRGDLARALGRVVRRVRDELAGEPRAEARARRPGVHDERRECVEHGSDPIQRALGATDHRDEPALARRIAAAGDTAVEQRDAGRAG